MKKAFASLLLLLSVIPFQSHAEDKAPPAAQYPWNCESNSWLLHLNIDDQTTKQDLVEILKLLTRPHFQIRATFGNGDSSDEAVIGFSYSGENEEKEDLSRKLPSQAFLEKASVLQKLSRMPGTDLICELLLQQQADKKPE